MDIIERVIFNNLIQHRSVILPGVGMLMVYRVAGSLDNTSGKLIAPSNRIEFSPEIPAGYPTIIDDIQKISEADATEVIPIYKNWITDRCKTNANQDIIIGNIGRATKLANGSFSFSPSKQLAEIINPLEERVIDLNARTTPPPIQGAVPPALQPARPHSSCEKTDAQKKNACRRNNIIMIGLTVLLLLCGLTWQLFFRESAQKTTRTSRQPEREVAVVKQEEQKPVQTVDTTPVAAVAEVEQPAKEAEAKVVEAPQAATKNFFIIGGLFSTEKNADRFIKMLGDKGEHAEKLEAKSNKIMVSVCSFETEAEARDYLKTVRRETPDYWLYIRR